MSHPVLEALREDDGDALAAAAPYDDAVAAAIHPALSELDVRGRLMATWVLARASGAQRADVLLDMTGDPVERVGLAAARELLALAPEAMPRAERLVHTIPVRLKPSVRSLLYRVVATKGDPSVLDLLRSIFDQERDEAALRDAHLAAARLGGPEERAALYERIEQAPPDDAAEAFDELVFVGDRTLARALDAWFEDETIAKVIGNHFRRTLIRVCDFAAVAASRLGLAFDHRGASAPLAVSQSPIPAEVIAAARAAVLALRPEMPARIEAPPQPAPVAPRPLVAPMAPLPAPRIGPSPAFTTSSASARATAPLPAGMPEPMTRPLVLPDVLPASTPFAAPAAPRPSREAAPTLQGVPFQPSRVAAPPAPAPRQRPRIPTGTVDLESALAAEKAAESSRSAARTTSSPPRGPQLGVEQYAWLCALVERRPEQRAEAWRRFGIPDEAGWGQLHATWQAWLAEDRARLARFHELVAEYRRANVSL